MALDCVSFSLIGKGAIIVSEQSALVFIRQFRSTRGFRMLGQAGGGDYSMDEILQLAVDRGFCFSKEELVAAHRHDWAMRWQLLGEGERL